LIDGATTTRVFTSAFAPNSLFENGSIVFEANFVWDTNDMVLYNGGWSTIGAMPNAVISNDGKNLTLTNLNTNSVIRGRASENIVQGQSYEVTITADADGDGSAFTPVSQTISNNLD